jgi:class 3 adenylate cyclase
LFNLQEFRDLFSRESLAADMKLSVGEQAILFTDMVGSTRFYETQGDPGAFKEVRRHFTEVYDEVRKHRGAVIKTIGDAAMAAFADPVDALRAAAGIQARFDGARADTPVRLRISLNSGPCIAVNLNSAIDYFGRTVNLAAKLQSLSGAGQIVFPRALASAPGVAALLAAQGATLEELEFENKALDRPMPVYRWDTGALALRSKDVPVGAPH